MRIADALVGVQRLGIDTSAIISFVEQDPTYYDVCETVFQAIDAGALVGVVASAALTEVLIRPLKTNDQQAASDYRALLTQAAGMRFYPIGRSEAEKAADHRARYNLSVPDALHVAAAMSANCDAFPTGDKTLRRVTEMTILILDELTIKAISARGVRIHHAERYTRNPPLDQLLLAVTDMEKEMKTAARALDFETAAQLRDEIGRLKKLLPAGSKK